MGTLDVSGVDLGDFASLTSFVLLLTLLRSVTLILCIWKLRLREAPAEGSFVLGF